ncbi:hypothetical protein CIP107534_02014 [Corynebacterium diphtheriae]|nr:hypothetical protein CIP107534_02014 [Corynebacterium diphtheriae]
MGSITNHLSNFIDTWDGWAKVISGLAKLDLGNIYDSLKLIVGAASTVATSSPLILPK